jgi:uncharacterized membrane protein
MTYRTQTILIALAAFLGGGIAGGVAGGYVAISFTSHFFADNSMLENGIDTQDYVSVLQSLRNGHIKEAAEHLEATMDHKIIGLRLSEENSARTNQAVREAIQKARDYRNKFPRHSGSKEIDQAISEALAQE